jgi:hypothetical protein
MKIKINENLIVDTICTQTTTCPAGTAYWRIDYRINGETIYSCSSGAIYGQPSPIEALDWERDVWDRTLAGNWTCNGKPQIGNYRKATNRALLMEAVAQLA